MAEETRAGFVALIGAPNAGKSTLLNALVGAKVSIVTHKVQTTRTLVRGIAMAGKSQIVFVDTPGIFAPKRRLDRAMVGSAWQGAADADLVALLIDAQRGLYDGAKEILGKLGEVPQPKILILNKIDLVEREKLLALTAQANELARFERTFMISAANGDGVADVREYFADAMPKGPWLYPEDEISDVPMRLMAAEITREKLFLRLHEELPYQSTVETDSWKEMKDGSVRIEQTVYVERDGQKKIVLGQAGKMIKSISMDARKEISAEIEKRVHLFLHVKVRENWGNDPERYRNIGLEYPKE
ncbi:MAG: GTPase Era [Xanthobacteraceae bacterium]|nr:GTPase Era [Xanthobacteraceae bacterium]QYK43727.1 MAG: GTPase Era [Xanthobacteraceae bacterium]